LTKRQLITFEQFDRASARAVQGVNANPFQNVGVGSKSFGVFGRGTFRFTDQGSATGGLRWSKDDRTPGLRNYHGTADPKDAAPAHPHLPRRIIWAGIAGEELLDIRRKGPAGHDRGNDAAAPA
jgi:outer membrane receptor protein involved in Fe transport